MAHLEELFKRLHEVNMKIHPKKCEFVVTSVVYLGHRILPNGIMVHWSKVVDILEMPNPTNVHTLRSFIRLCNYYRIYVQNFNTIAHPLYALLKKDVAWTLNVMHSQFLARLKGESKYKTTEGGGVEARSLVHNTLKGRGAC